MTQSRGKIYDSILDTIGATPLVRLPQLTKKYGLEADILAKLEFFNPLSSVKDRIAKSMIEAAEVAGEITPGKTTLIEATSGNTGVGLAFIAAAKGYKLILTMPESMSVERRKMLALMGAKLVLTPREKGMKGAIAKAEEILNTTQDGWTSRQFDNEANPNIHAQTTAEEIWADTNGKVDIVVSGVGTGGTITGVTRTLKEKNKNIQIIAVEPTDSPVLSGGEPGMHKIQGIGAGFIPSIMEPERIDEIIQITNEETFEMAQEAAKVEGLAVGISSGAALRAAIRVAQRPENKGKQIVVIIPSFAERYLSTALFDGLEITSEVSDIADAAE